MSSKRLKFPTAVLFFVILLLVCLTPEGSFVQAQSKPREKPRLKDFGSSLDRLKWDKKRGSAVDVADKSAGSQSIGEDEVIQVETDLVVCDVQIRNRRGQVVTGLAKDDFIVTEDGEPQQIVHFSLGSDLTVPRTIVLLIDYSGSQHPFIKDSVEAAKILVDSLGPEDNMAIVTDDVELLVNFTQDRAKLKKALDKIYNKTQKSRFGKSRQFTALMAIVREMFSPEDLRPIIIFQTDGDEIVNLRPSQPPLFSIPPFKWTPPGEIRQDKFSLRDLYYAIEKSNASVYTVIPGQRLIPLSSKELKPPPPTTTQLKQITAYVAVPPEFDRLDFVRWGQMAAAGAAIGGWTAFLENPAQANKIYQDILEDIGSRYVIGYYPTNKARDGKRRRVNLAVRENADYQFSGRKSYFAPGPN